LLTYLGLPDRDLSILLTDNKGITHYNKKCFGKDAATNVISFSYPNGFQPEVLGDIVISAERAREEAEAAGIPLCDRLVALIVHGLVHVLGFDHEAGPTEARRMRYREKKLLGYVRELDACKETVL
jgi:probable rRNA maturation factor